MPVHRGSDAAEYLRLRLDGTVRDIPPLGTSLPKPFVPQPPTDGWLWDSGRWLAGLRGEEAYGLTRDAALRELLHAPPATVVDDASISAAHRHAYCRHSIDVTMRGGTASGVVYPLAICELAREFRLRNIGGASAGAIAAAAAAAAETGRQAIHTGKIPPAAPPSGGERAQGHVRPGFAGLADSLAWLAEIDEYPAGAAGRYRPRYRLAQLFRPASATVPLYLVGVAIMRKRWLALPLLLGSLLSWGARFFGAVCTLAVLTLIALTAMSGGSPLLRVALAVSGLTATAILAAGLLTGMAGLRRWRAGRKRDHPDLAEPVLAPPAMPRWQPCAAIFLLLTIFGASGLAAPLLLPQVDSWRYLLAVPSSFVVLVALLAALHVYRVWQIAGKGSGITNFGLMAGASRQDVIRPSWWRRIAGAVPHTIDRALTEWLSDTLTELAGISEPDRILRFGHLWWGADWSHTGGPADDVAARDIRQRQVNLELMTSELVQRIPYRLPLRLPDQRDADGNSTLYVRRADLAEMFPDNVLDALCANSSTARSVLDGSDIDGLAPLPEPWNLPVIFAVRLSSALPIMFTAVRLYRRVRSHQVRDDFGCRITRAGSEPLRYPAGSDSDPMWVEPLWFSDGGITSNFPIHFFDAPLPLWPTVGINLGSHPRGFAHQDIWLPADGQPNSPAANPLDANIFSFAGAIFGTTHDWRDTMHTFMPSSRGRVAWVRERSDEGGNNLFMQPAQIASLAIRGALAGARLRRRFGSESHWEWHQWLRLRIAVANLVDLQCQTGRALDLSYYADLLDTAPSPDDGANFGAELARLAELLEAAGGDAEQPEKWWLPTPQENLIEQVRALLAAYRDPRPPANSAAANMPYPAPDLRQVPPV